MAWEGAYELTYEGLFNNKIKVKKYLSKVTRLKIAFANVPGPLVHGKFALATEDSSDDGLPHILEHVIFLGSEDYPHKGVLDKVATRCFSNGTNATTDTDVTIYEITTAGQEGFLNIFPIYLEHILFPRLTDAAYVTEVHHVDGEGRDAGTVYSEMQERENTSEDITDLALRRALYPSPQCGYRFNTGGLLGNIRNSTNNQKVKDFHKRFYRPENLCLVVIGDVNEESFFKVLSRFEEKVVGKGLSSSFKRPWQTPVEPLQSSNIVEALYPNDDEEEGEVTVAWRGPNINDSYRMVACWVLLDYLQDSAVSVLYQSFVEVPDPLCTEIGYTVYENIETSLVLTFTSVPIEKLNLIEPRLLEVLKRVHNEGFDMKRLVSLIKNRAIHIYDNLENDPASTLSNDLVIDFLYAVDKTHTNDRLNARATLSQLLTEPESFWKAILSLVLITKPHVTIVSKPSASFAEEHEKQEEKRIDDRKKLLGEEGLKQKAQILAASIEQNETPIPEEVLLSVKIPSLSSIKRHALSTFSNHPASHPKGVSSFETASSFNSLPFTLHLHQVDTSFVTISVLLDASDVPEHLLPYLTLFNELLFESPINFSGELLDYKSVIEKLVDETVEYSASVGFSGDRFLAGEFASYFHLSIKVEMERYKEGVKWCSDLLTGVVFDKERLRSVASKCLGDAKTEKKDARVVMEQLSSVCIFKKESPIVQNSMVKQLAFLKEILDRKDNKKDLANINELRKKLLKKGGMLVNITTDVDQLAKTLSSTLTGDNIIESLAKVWQDEFVSKLEDAGSSQIELWPLRRDLVFRAPPSPTHKLVALASTDSSYLSIQTDSFNHLDHVDYPAVLTLYYFINMLEGPVWRAIRGNGLAYGFGVNFNLDQGLRFRLLGSTNLVEAFKLSYSFMKSLCDGEIEISQSELECARCDCIYELLSMQATPLLASERALLCSLRDLPQDFYGKLIEKVSNINQDDMKRVACQYFKKLFTPESTAVIVCPSGQASSIAKQFNDLFQIKFDVYKNVDNVAF